MKPADLIAHAERLTASAKRKPYQADMRRAVSAAYYALFHAIAGTAADTLIGTTASHRSSETWRRVYRSLEHGFAKSQCLAKGASEIPATLRDTADAFVQLQELRHAADYDPMTSFLLEDVRAHIVQSKTAIGQLAAASASDRRSFAAWLVFRSRA
jgi:uncharacterized protein (UPF0332 family)